VPDRRELEEYVDVVRYDANFDDPSAVALRFAKEEAE